MMYRLNAILLLPSLAYPRFELEPWHNHNDHSYIRREQSQRFSLTLLTYAQIIELVLDPVDNFEPNPAILMALQFNPAVHDYLPTYELQYRTAR
jgi:hypothetical protein